MMKYNIFLWLFILINPLYGQVIITNNSIILKEFATLPHLIPKGVTNAKIIIKLDNYTDTTEVELDSLHRVVNVSNFYLQCSILYEDKLITKRYQQSFPNYFFPSCYDFITKYHLDEKGYIISSSTNCNSKKESKKESVKHYYEMTINNHNSITNSIMIAPVSELKNGYEVQNSYQSIIYDDVKNMMHYNYATNNYRLVYSIDDAQGLYSFYFKSKFSKKWLNCNYSRYDVNKKFNGLLQTPLYNTESIVIGELIVIKG